MRTEHRVLIFCMTLLVAVPALYALGEWLGGLPGAVALPAAATLASYLYAQRGDTTEPRPAASPVGSAAVGASAPEAKTATPPPLAPRTELARAASARSRQAVALLIGSLALGGAPAAASECEPAEAAGSQPLYAEAQRELESGSPERALCLLEEYLDFRRSRHRPEQVFGAIDRVAQIYLGVKRDPAGALAFFERLRDDARLTDIDRGAIEEWIAVARDWTLKRAEGGSGLRDPRHLFQRGKRYFDSGVAKTRTGIPSFAGADFHIAHGYLLQLAILHDKSPRTGEVLHMLGAMRYHARSDDPRWSDNFYLKEAIRRFPHTPVALRSYELLRRNAGRIYAPALMPAELAENLSFYEELARPLAPAA